MQERSVGKHIEIVILVMYQYDNNNYNVYIQGSIIPTFIHTLGITVLVMSFTCIIHMSKVSFSETVYIVVYSQLYHNHFKA